VGFPIKNFRVLVLDDSSYAIECIKRRIQGARALGQLDPVLPVDVETILIELEPGMLDPEMWVFSAGTSRLLAAACERAPDLILVDYGFVDPSLGSQLRLQAASREITAEELKGKVLTAYDLARWCREQSPLDSHTRSRIRKNLFESGRPVYLYSYRARELWRAVGSMDERARRIRDAFPRSRVSIIDARRELYNEDDFDSLGASKYDPKFYAYQISVILDYIVQKEILRALLKRSRYLRVKRTASATAVLAAIGAALGVGGHWAGELSLSLFSHGNFLFAFVFAAGILAVLFFSGFGAALLFERAMERLLQDVDKED
jgi:hypothetical protein